MSPVDVSASSVPLTLQQPPTARGLCISDVMRLEASTEPDPTGFHPHFVDWNESKRVIDRKQTQFAATFRRDAITASSKPIALELSHYHCRSFPHADHQLSMRYGGDTFGA